MPELKIAIGSIRYEISCQEGEEGIINDIARKINTKINLLSLEIGRINEKILLLLLLIQNTKKLEKIKGGKFEDNLINILKIIAPLLSSKDDKTLEGNLIVANIMKESELMEFVESDNEEVLENNEDGGFNKEQHYKEMSELIDNIAGYMVKITENLS